jgi:hypothetical protein
MSEWKPAPARLFVLLARTAPVGVILRRGPSQWVQLIKWNTDTDTFEPGQWFKGRIYEDKCDLSPDGKLLIYFAKKSGNSFKHPDYGDSWTAISKPPYFTALALWPVWGMWRGGGLFRSNEAVYLNHHPAQQPHPDHQPHDLEVIQDEDWYVDVGILSERMSRDGWESIQTGKDIALRLKENSPELLEWHRYDYWLEKLDRPSIWYKRVKDYALEKHHFGYRAQRGHIAKHYLINRRNNKRVELSSATWADGDPQERVLFTKEGKLFTAAITAKGELALTELADFNANKPEPIETPAWAKKW